MRPSLRVLAILIVAIAGPALAADPPAHIVIDADAGTVLEHRQADRLWYPASLTKLMTAYVTFKELKAGNIEPTSRVTMTKNAVSEPPSKMGFKTGTVLNVDNALKMMIVKSANDIAVAVAEAVGGSEPAFVGMMNREARRLGMTSTRFKNPNGLPDGGQVTTARDMAVLARAVWVDFPEYREYFRISAIKHGKHVIRSYNTLLEHYHGTNGMKTGFICASGFNMIASATRHGRTVIVVVLGERSSRDRAEKAAELLNKGFRRGFVNGGPELASFEAARVTGEPMNMREFGICGKRRAVGESDEAGADGRAPRSALEPRFVLMKPVPVYTGRADPPGAAPAAKVPLPRLRPRPLPAGTSAALEAGEPLRLVR